MKTSMKMIWVALLLMVPLTLLAEPVDETQARQQAQAFLQARGKSLSAKSIRMALKGRSTSSNEEGMGTDAYYVFNIGNTEGFVIVSGDDRTIPILGYADSGNLDEMNLPDGLRYLLNGYAEQIALLQESGSDANDVSLARKEVKRSVARSTIAPLIDTRWDQGAPYNALCPVVSSMLTVTGCVATSMAQVMNYYHHPATACSAIPAYSTTTKDKDNKSVTLNVDGLEASTFEWNKMTPTYAAGDTGDEAAAVAKLMYYCGVALQMRYGLGQNGGSSAYNVSIAEALKTYFNYDGTATYLQRPHYSYQEWVELIYAELAAQRPVVLGGQSIGGGHSFVCDGYDTDDYFHINWGWGGNSDGFFRLSLLNPYEQGIGGSSTLDGFSYGQDAVIGIRPYAGTSTAVRLSLERMQLDAAGSASTLVLNRDNANDAFTGISVYYCVCRYNYTTSVYDYALQLTAADGTVIKTLQEVENKTMTFNKDEVYTLSDLSTPDALADGTYYIKVVSRATGDTDWQECYEGSQQRLTATVSGNTMTIAAPIVYGLDNLPTAATISVSGDLIQGHEQEVTVSITGGAADYHGEVLLQVNGKSAVGKTLDIPAGSTVDAHFTFIPTKTGDNTLKIIDRKNNRQIGSTTTVVITANDATNTQTLSLTPVIANLSDGKLYGNALRVTATVTNPSSENSYASRLNCSLRTYNNATDNINDYIDATVKSYNISIGKSGTTDVTFEYTGLELGKFYCMRFTYTQSYEQDGVTKTRTQEAFMTDRYEMGEGYFAYNADGTNTILPKPTGTIEGGSAVCVDLTSITNPSMLTVIPSTNPNCVYLLAAGAAVPEGLSGCNVVIGNTANTLTLQDGYDFYTPVAFTATNATYTRTFSNAANVTSGWNTLFLPFTATAVSCGDRGAVDWFRNDADEGKHFWLRAFTAADDDTITFDYTQEIAANTPYIIAVPGDTWGAQWLMTGKPVTFMGINVSILATATAGVSGNHYKFCGSTVSDTKSDVYLLNAAGSSFVKAKTSTTAEPFRAWFAPVSISSLSRSLLRISNPGVTGIKNSENNIE